MQYSQRIILETKNNLMEFFAWLIKSFSTWAFIKKINLFRIFFFKRKFYPREPIYTFETIATLNEKGSDGINLRLMKRRLNKVNKRNQELLYIAS